nr:reverse transcriptase domain-containing protein [Tanacetum cinerariifolium]
MVSKPNATLVPGMFKLDIEPISVRLKNNRDAHEVYIDKTIEYANTLRGFVEHARTQYPSDPLLESACMFTKLVQEWLVYNSLHQNIVRKPTKLWGSNATDGPSSSSFVNDRLSTSSSVVKLKDLPPHLEYAFLVGDDKLPVIIAKYLSVEEKTTLIIILKSYKRAIAWKLFDIKGIKLEFCTHKILMEEDFEPTVQHLRRVNLKIHDVIKQEVIKLLEAGLIYPISDSPWVIPGETIWDFYLRFSLLLNDMNLYNMKLEQFQVNTKFLNTLPSEWSNFVRLMNERTTDPLALISQHQLNRTPYPHHQPMYQQSQFQPQATSYQSSPYGPTYHNSQFVASGPSSLMQSISYPGTDTSSLDNHNAYLASSLAPQIAYAQMDHQSSEYSPPEAGLVVPVFQKGDDPIDAINHMMSFLTSVVASRFPATNNQLRTSSNPRQQATINNGRITIQPIQGRQNYVSVGSSRPFTSGQWGAQVKERVIMCYNCKGEGHMSKQCTKPKRKRDAEW